MVGMPKEVTAALKCLNGIREELHELNKLKEKEINIIQKNYLGRDNQFDLQKEGDQP